MENPLGARRRPLPFAPTSNSEGGLLQVPRVGARSAWVRSIITGGYHLEFDEYPPPPRFIRTRLPANIRKREVLTLYVNNLLMEEAIIPVPIKTKKNNQQ
ncbi:Hypothetical predicted protein [Pelobates cultripes]|uniref:Uncharacterized protein n=1 Tax=Pelobates cultripes TaxID=61616 RepID=A0AAD1VVK3_PELCU|nr:Hypothetical predicted protein [Pelobates cultripes]